MYFLERRSEQIVKYLFLKTVTYGTTSAPFLAIRCLLQLAEENKDKFPLASFAISNFMYVDDVLAGGDTMEGVLSMRNELLNVLEAAGFKLSKWSANNFSLVRNIDNTSNAVGYNFDKNGDTKALGLIWNCLTDNFKFEIKVAPPEKTTKRSILSQIAKIFDPLGLIGPVTITAKILLQQLWAINLNWDDKVPRNINETWMEYVNNLAYLNDLNIPRKVISSFPNQSIELHGFCDSSLKAYAAVIYIVTVGIDGNRECQLLCAKSRVAPLKTISIPRLELCGAVLLARLYNTVINILNVNINQYFLWTDSTVVINWITQHPSRWKTFVANRVSEIQTLTEPSKWFHVKSNDNPADIISRGMLPSEIKNCTLWWQGPNWLKFSIDEWPISEAIVTHPDVELEKRNVSLSCVAVYDELPIFTKCSSFSKLLLVLAYCLRFIKNCRKATKKQKGKIITIADINESNKCVVRYVQRHAFAYDLKCLAQNAVIDPSSKIKSLNPFLDSDGIIKVGGRLRNAPIKYDARHPAILPRDNYVTSLIIKSEHERLLHAGQQTTLYSLRQRYWILSGRSTVRKVLRHCIKCFKVNPKPIVQKMGDLPQDRLQPIRAFLKTGVDYAGPILVKEGGIRSKKRSKAYVAVFVCFATKAVHLELVSNLTAASFIAAFNRFISRRGHVSDLYCDNATNFIGAKNELQKTLHSISDKIHDNFMLHKINWHFIPARSPNFGGLWERSIQSIKQQLKRVAGNAHLTYEELYTLLVRIEACVNSRPLSPLNNDPNDLQVLCPSHFLIFDSLTSPVEVNVTDAPLNRLSRWQRIEQMRQHFWRRWMREYLTELQRRPRGSDTHVTQIVPGSMVLLVENNVPPLCWKLGRIVEVHPGADNIVRVVSIKTANGVVRRAVKGVRPTI